MADQREAPDAAMKLAEHLLRIRIDVRTLAYESSGGIKDQSWSEAYQLMRAYEDADIRDMLNGTRAKPARNKTQRRRDKKRKQIQIATATVVIEKKRAGQHSGKHPWRAKATRKT